MFWKRQLVILFFFFSLVHIYAQSQNLVEGVATVRSEEFPESGLFAKSGIFPVGKQVTVYNPQTKEKVNVQIIEQLANSSEFMVVTPEVARKVGMGSIAVVVVSDANGAFLGNAQAQALEEAFHPDPDINPGAELYQRKPTPTIVPNTAIPKVSIPTNGATRSLADTPLQTQETISPKTTTQRRSPLSAVDPITEIYESSGDPDVGDTSIDVSPLYAVPERDSAPGTVQTDDPTQRAPLLTQQQPLYQQQYPDQKQYPDQQQYPDANVEIFPGKTTATLPAEQRLQLDKDRFPSDTGIGTSSSPLRKKRFPQDIPEQQRDAVIPPYVFITPQSTSTTDPDKDSDSKTPIEPKEPLVDAAEQKTLVIPDKEQRPIDKDRTMPIPDSAPPVEELADVQIEKLIPSVEDQADVQTEEPALPVEEPADVQDVQTEEPTIGQIADETLEEPTFWLHDTEAEEELWGQAPESFRTDVPSGQIGFFDASAPSYDDLATQIQDVYTGKTADAKNMYTDLVSPERIHPGEAQTFPATGYFQENGIGSVGEKDKAEDALYGKQLAQPEIVDSTVPVEDYAIQDIADIQDDTVDSPDILPPEEVSKELADETEADSLVADIFHEEDINALLSTVDTRAEDSFGVSSPRLRTQEEDQKIGQGSEVVELLEPEWVGFPLAVGKDVSNGQAPGFTSPEFEEAPIAVGEEITNGTQAELLAAEWDALPVPGEGGFSSDQSDLSSEFGMPELRDAETAENVETAEVAVRESAELSVPEFEEAPIAVGEEITNGTQAELLAAEWDALPVPGEEETISDLPSEFGMPELRGAETAEDVETAEVAVEESAELSVPEFEEAPIAVGEEVTNGRPAELQAAEWAALPVPGEEQSLSSLATEFGIPELEEVASIPEETGEEAAEPAAPELEEVASIPEEAGEEAAEPAAPEFEEVASIPEEAGEEAAEPAAPEFEEVASIPEETGEEAAEPAAPEFEEVASIPEETGEEAAEPAAPEFEEVASIPEETGEEAAEPAAPEFEEVASIPEKATKALSEPGILEFEARPPIKEESIHKLPPGLKGGSDAYYVQVAAVSQRNFVEKILQQLSAYSPFFVQSVDMKLYRVYVGPLNKDERGLILYKIRSLGFVDAFFRSASIGSVEF